MYGPYTLMCSDTSRRAPPRQASSSRKVAVLPCFQLQMPCLGGSCSSMRSIGRADVSTLIFFGQAVELRLGIQIRTDLSLSALVMTETELKLIAAAAIIGESSNPNSGYSTPAATGTPKAL